MKCIICERNFEKKAALSTHITRSHNLPEVESCRMAQYSIYGKTFVDEIVDKYVNELLCIYEIPNGIGKLIKLLGLKRTSSEERHTKRYKEKFLNIIKSKYGEEYTNISQVPFVQKKKEETFAKKFGSYEKYCEYARTLMREGYSKMSKEKIDKMKSNLILTMISKYGVENPSQIPFVREKISSSIKKRMKNLSKEEKRKMTSKARETFHDHGGYSSNLEKIIQKILVELGENFIHNKNKFGYNWDIIIEDKKLIIEIQGTLFHADPEFYNSDFSIRGWFTAKDVWEKDRVKKEKAESNGYKVIYIWEKEIRKKTNKMLEDMVRTKINEAVEK